MTRFPLYAKYTRGIIFVYLVSEQRLATAYRNMGIILINIRIRVIFQYLTWIVDNERKDGRCSFIPL